MPTRILMAVFLLAASALGQSTAGAPATQAAHYPNLIHAEQVAQSVCLSHSAVLNVINMHRMINKRL